MLVPAPDLLLKVYKYRCTRTHTTAMGCGASAPAGPIADMSPALLQKWLASEGLTKQAPALEGLDGAWLAGACLHSSTSQLNLNRF